MKFKIIFIIFNAVILFSFLFVFFMPYIILGGDYFSVFASKNWLAAILFLAVLVIINCYFVSNWKLFGLLEKENWPELISFLEDRIYRKKILRKSYLRMLINTYLITSNIQKIKDLEIHLQEKQPALLKKFALQFGIPYLLKNSPEDSEKYFGRSLAYTGVDNRDWIRWNYAFALMQQKDFSSAKAELLKLVGTRDPVMRLLTIYMLDSYSTSDNDLKEKIKQEQTRLKKRYTSERWQKRINRGGNNMEMVLLGRIIKDASDWLYGCKEITPDINDIKTIN